MLNYMLDSLWWCRSEATSQIGRAKSDWLEEVHKAPCLCERDLSKLAGQEYLEFGTKIDDIARDAYVGPVTVEQKCAARGERVDLYGS